MSVVGTLAVKIVGDSSHLDRTLNTSQTSIKRFGVAAGVAVAAAATGLSVMVRRTIDAMDEMGKASRRIGITVEQLSALKFQADFAGVSMGELESSVRTLSRSMLQAAQGNQQTSQLFKDLGVNVLDSNGQLRDTYEVLQEVADGFQRMEDGARKTAAAQQLFRNTSIVNVLNEGAEGMMRYADKADELGVLMSTEMSLAAEQFNNNMTMMGKHVERFTIYLANKTLPFLNRFMERMSIAFGSTAGALTLSARQMAEPERAIEKINIQLDDLYAKAEHVANFFAANPSMGMSSFLGDIDPNVIEAQVIALEEERKALVELIALRKAMSMPDVDADGMTVFSPFGAGRGTDRIKDQLEAVRRITKEYERERDFQLEIMQIRDDMAGMTKDEQAVQEAINDVLQQTSRSLQQIADQRLEAANLGASQAVLSQFDAEAQKIKDLSKSYVELARAQKQSAIDAQRQFSFGWNTAFAQYAENATNAALIARNMFTATTANMDNAIRNFVETGKLSFSDLAASIIKDIIRIQLQAQVSQAFSQIISIVGGAIGGMFSSATAMTIPQATAMGAGTTAGGAGAVAFPVSLASGGYTGDGGQFEPAGIVHRGEYVLNAAATRRIGLANLEKMNQGFAMGGLVGSTGMSGKPSVEVNVINQSSTPLTARATTPQFDGEKFVQNVILQDIRRNGPIGQALRGGA